MRKLLKCSENPQVGSFRARYEIDRRERPEDQYVYDCPGFVVHEQLRRTAAPYARLVADFPVRWVYAADVGEALSGGGKIAVVPALNDLQIDQLRELVEAHPLVTHLGVVADLVGQGTQRAIQAGAASVLNVLIPPQEYRAVLRALAAQLARPVADRVLTLAGCSTPAAAAGPIAAPPPPAAADEEDAELFRLLCGPLPISRIADELFCSERSTYRRARRLYSAYGVSGRHELRAVSARRRSPDPLAS
ncbi:hypothetical protein [Kitasatospora sp. NPDC004531]